MLPPPILIERGDGDAHLQRNDPLYTQPNLETEHEQTLRPPWQNDRKPRFPTLNFQKSHRSYLSIDLPAHPPPDDSEARGVLHNALPWSRVLLNVLSCALLIFSSEGARGRRRGEEVGENVGVEEQA